MFFKGIILYLGFFITTASHLEAKTFFVDPLQGDITNDGSINSPWSTLEEVVNSNLVQSFSYNQLPYDPDVSQLILKNPNAPITGGDTIVLREGLHGELFLRNYFNKDYITIIAQEGHTPILQNIHIQAGAKWHFENVSINPELYNTDVRKLVYFETHGFQGPCKQISITGCDIRTTEYPWTTAEDWLSYSKDGIYMRGDSMYALRNTVTNVDMGITAYGDYIIASQNEVINFSGDGMRLLGSNNIFSYNTIKNCYNVDDNHDDGIQSFTTNGIIVDNNIIESNIIINNEDPNQILSGPLQGIGCFDGFYNNWLVQNNLIYVNHWHGITLLGANNCRIINNTVIDPTPNVTPGASWIRIDDHKDGRPSSNCIVKNNVANKFVIDAIEDHNVELLDIEDYNNEFIDVSNMNFNLLSTSLLIDNADDNYAPAEDIERNIRPQGNHSDIGCYEYVNVTQTNNTTTTIDIKIFPNPTYGNLNILNIPDDKTYTINIINMNGQLIDKFDFSSSTNPIALEGIGNGIYIIKVISAKNKIIKQQKLIIIQ